MQHTLLTERTRANCGHTVQATVTFQNEPSGLQINRHHMLHILEMCSECRNGTREPDLAARVQMCCPKHIWEHFNGRKVCTRCLKTDKKNGSK